MKFIDSNMKNTTVKFTNCNGKKIESVEKHNCKPKMSFYENLAKSAISGIIGTKKPRFNIEWNAQFRSDRFRGLEKQTMMVDENPECALDTSFRTTNLSSLFNAFQTQSPSTIPKLTTLV